ncbi:MAG: 50S ribosomal protein L7/L12 [Patescibacteria group bacterium]|nr:50S ribosomal protein L7/L12 [Patescibacteria group bacterium]
MAEEKKVSETEKEKVSKESKEEAKEIEIPKKFKSIVEEIEKMSVLDLAELVKIFEDKFGVSAAAPMAVAAPAAVGEAAEGEAEEKAEYDVELVAVGDSKINVIKKVKEITGIGLKDAKDMVDGAPKVIKEKVAKEEAEEFKKGLEEVGATVELK